MLLLQIEEIVEGRVTDLWLERSRKAASDLEETERTAILQDFFKIHWDNLVKPEPRYWELLQKRGLHLRGDELCRVARSFTGQELLDLQVWFNLAWCGYTAFRQFPELRELKRKGRDFTEAEKARLLEIHLEIMRRVPGKYRAAEERGHVELTTSPLFHPILPLVYDSAFAERSLPGRSFPNRFHWPEDSRAQLTLAVEQHERIFGRKPRGLWPSEGAIAPELIPLMSDVGIEYFCSDEENLFESIRRDQAFQHAQIDHLELFQGWRIHYEGTSVNGVFREKPLSDFIGFMAAKNPSERAARHLIEHLQRIADLVPPDQGLIPLILDGENAWETVPDGGEAFLRALYGGIAADPVRLHSCTIETYFRRHPPARHLSTLHTGSWISSNFDIWIGEDEENRAWDLLGKTREFLQLQIDAGTLDEAKKTAALREIYAAEGSDWFWWYGPDFSTDNDALFDDLFRQHLKNVYALCGERPPAELETPIARGLAVPVFDPPTRQIAPTIDGRQGSYFEWLGSGTYLPGSEQGAMYRSERLGRKLWFGCDDAHLYLRLDLANTTTRQAPFALVLVVGMEGKAHPADGPATSETFTAKTETIEQAGTHHFTVITEGGKRLRRSSLASGEIVEWAIRFADIGVAPGVAFRFHIKILRGGIEQERYPERTSITLRAPDAESTAAEWVV